MSPEQLEVWAAEERYWTLRAAGKISEFMALWDDEVAGWPHTTDGLITKSDIRDEVTRQIAAESNSHAALEPLSVRIHSDFAFVFYRVRLGRESFRIHHTWHRTPTGWKIIAGMSALDTNG
jgi:uncharacterized protein DUF4440